MIVIYGKTYLKELHLHRRASDKKHRFQPDVIKRYIKTVEIMISVKNVLELSRINSLRYEKLSGNKKGLSSVRVNDKYRIEFEEHAENQESIATICNLIELSNHYN